jgi:ribose-phosphate pyrophosphokinase
VSALIGTVIVSQPCGLSTTSITTCDDGFGPAPLRRSHSRLIPRRSSRLIRDEFAPVSRSEFLEATEESEYYYVNPEKQQNTMIFAPPHNSELVAEVCSSLGLSMSRSFCGKFADGECSIRIQDEVRGADCFVIQMIPRGGEEEPSSCSKGSHLINDSIMEMLLMTAALRRASARSITVVLPYVPYARHMEGIPDGEHLTPMAASDIAQLIEAAGADKVIVVDVHRGTFEGCFSSNVKVSNIDPQVLAVKYFEQRRLVDPVIVSPDVVASDRAKAFYKRMRMHGFECQLATMVSDRKYQYQASRTAPSSTEGIRLLQDGKILLPSGKAVSLAALMTREWLVGDVTGRDCIIVDDMIDSGKRLTKTSETLKKCGARRIYFYATHGVLSGPALKRIDQSPVTEVVVTNTLPPRRDVACDKLRVLSVAGLLSETIRRVQMGESVSSLYDRAVIDASLEERLNPAEHSSLL